MRIDMTKVITYGSFDMLHYGHIRLLERAKALGDYLIVGVTSDDYDKTRGKINIQQSLMERVEAVRATGIADEIIVEEYEGQKIDDIRRFDIDIFTVGSDWKGHFDYLKEYCEVVYLPRTEGVSSTDIRSGIRKLRLGVVGNAPFLDKFLRESKYVDGVEIVGVYLTEDGNGINECISDIRYINTYEELVELTDAVYILTKPEYHYRDVLYALRAGKHVLCESPISYSPRESEKLIEYAKSKNLILMDAIKTAYATAFERLILIAKSGKIGDIVSVDATCTSLRDGINTPEADVSQKWNSMEGWGPVALLPVFYILGTDYCEKRIYTKWINKDLRLDMLTKIEFAYRNAVASIKVAKGAKSEGELVITGTSGYIYVPAPWWKTDYFEIRFENPEDNKRMFYQLDGEGIRYEIVAFAKSIQKNIDYGCIPKDISIAITRILGDFMNGIDMYEMR